MTMEAMDPDILCLLHRLGITANYTGFFHTARAIRLCAEEPDRLLLVTKLVYPEVAKAYRTNWQAVERNIRTVTAIAWDRGRPALEQLAGRALPHRPCAAQLRALLTYELLTRRAVPQTQETAPTE